MHPNAVPAGANATLDIRVPNEMDNAKTTKLQVQFPPGFIGVSTQPPPGWTSKVQTSKLAKPVQTDDGPIDTQVSEVDWTAGSGAGIPPGQFANFPISVALPGRPGQTLTFKTVQTYSNGQVVRWIGAPDSDQPAPTIDVTAKGGVLQDVAGGEAGPGPLPAAAAAGSKTRRPRPRGPWSRSNPATTRWPSSRSSSACSDSPPAPPVSRSPGAREEVSAPPSERSQRRGPHAAERSRPTRSTDERGAVQLAADALAPVDERADRERHATPGHQHDRLRRPSDGARRSRLTMLASAGR